MRRPIAHAVPARSASIRGSEQSGAAAPHDHRSGTRRISGTHRGRLAGGVWLSLPPTPRHGRSVARPGGRVQLSDLRECRAV